MSTPRKVDLEITSACNLRCKYCNHFSSPGDVQSDLPADQWLEFFEELKRCAVMKITLQGGEPFIRDDIGAIIDGIVQSNMRYYFLSNGSLITEEMAEYMQSTGRCDGVQLSVDGSKASVHDSCRGDGAFNETMAALQTLKTHNVPVGIRVTLHKKNVHDMENIARLLLEDLGLPTFSINSVSYMGLCRQNSSSLQLDTADRTAIMQVLLDLYHKYNGRISSTSGPLSDAQMWSAMERARKERADALPNRGYLTACGCVMNAIGVRADGVIVPCLLMGHIELGRINKDDLQEVWLHSAEMNRLRERRAIPLTEFEFCKGCDYINYCTGNCPAASYNILKTDEHPSPDSCLRRFLEDGGKLPEDRRGQ
jgi:SynChlorMet cassette radical SAM/SPASM protein ScmE